LTASDARDMAAIHAESFERPWGALDMAIHTQRDICFGIENNDNLAAFIILSNAAGQAEVLTLATAKPARRKGFARQALQGAIETLPSRGTTEMFLEVAEDNEAAIHLYADGRVAAITFSKKL